MACKLHLKVSCYLDNKAQALCAFLSDLSPFHSVCQTRQRLPAPGPLDLLFTLRDFLPPRCAVLFPLLPWGSSISALHSQEAFSDHAKIALSIA